VPPCAARSCLPGSDRARGTSQMASAPSLVCYVRAQAGADFSCTGKPSGKFMNEPLDWNAIGEVVVLKIIP